MPNDTDTIRDQIIRSLGDREYREALVQESINQGIAFQLRANRAARHWTQTDLARRTGKAQPEISRLEDPDYEGYTLKTLSKIASAFDVALSVRFIPYSELVDHMVNDRDFVAASYGNDVGLVPATTDGATQLSLPVSTTDRMIMPPNVLPIIGYIRVAPSSAAAIKMIIGDESSSEENQWPTPSLANAR